MAFRGAIGFKLTTHAPLQTPHAADRLGRYATAAGVGVANVCPDKPRICRLQRCLQPVEKAHVPFYNPRLAVADGGGSCVANRVAIDD